MLGYVTHFLLSVLFLRQGISLHSLGWPGTHRHPPASTSLVLFCLFVCFIIVFETWSHVAQASLLFKIYCFMCLCVYAHMHVHIHICRGNVEVISKLTSVFLPCGSRDESQSIFGHGATPLALRLALHSLRP